MVVAKFRKTGLVLNGILQVPKKSLKDQRV